MALALTIFAITLASLALGVQLADLRAERVARGVRPAGPGAAMPPAAAVHAGNDNDPTAVKAGITLVRRTSAKRRAGHCQSNNRAHPNRPAVADNSCISAR